MTYNQLKPGSVLVARNDSVGIWLVIGKNDGGHNVWVDLSNLRYGVSTAQGEDDEIDFSFYQLFTS